MAEVPPKNRADKITEELFETFGWILGIPFAIALLIAIPVGIIWLVKTIWYAA